MECSSCSLVALQKWSSAPFDFPSDVTSKRKSQLRRRLSRVDRRDSCLQCAAPSMAKLHLMFGDSSDDNQGNLKASLVPVALSGQTQCALRLLSILAIVGYLHNRISGVTTQCFEYPALNGSS